MRPEIELVVALLTKAEGDLRLAELALGAHPLICWALRSRLKRMTNKRRTNAASTLP